MQQGKGRTDRAISVWWLFPAAAVLLFGCRTWTPAPAISQPAPLAVARQNSAASLPLPTLPVAPAQPPVTQESQSTLALPAEWQGEPAGCLDSGAQSALDSIDAMLAYADSLVRLERPLAARASAAAWNARTNTYDYRPRSPVTVDVADVKNVFLIQRMLNALHVAGFAAWLRDSDRPEQGLHILAIPLLDAELLDGDWAAYVRAYWQDAGSLPEGDAQVQPSLKLAPCRWMVARGFAPAIDPGWWPEGSDRWPDYVEAGQKYLAADMQAATRVAREIDWNAHLEAANTMCGPLTWSILNEAGAFPPGMGAWREGPQTFWLAKPTENGRPWSLFPSGTYTVRHFGTAFSRFDFSTFPLVSGDVLYLYSEKDGFDHILLVTETYADGSVFTVTNLTRSQPEQVITVERRLLLHTIDREAGLARNEWEDRTNGRTGHAGFDVFRWDWVEKDIANTPVPYQVLPGDTFGFLAARWKTPADKIARYNGISIDSALIVGQILFIPPNQWELAP